MNFRHGKIIRSPVLFVLKKFIFRQFFVNFIKVLVKYFRWYYNIFNYFV